MPKRLLLSLLLLASAPLAADTPPETEQQARAILKHSVETRTVIGAGKVPELAEYLATQLRESGYAAADIEIIPFGETAAMLARYRGSNPAAAPLVLSAHMDVVEARPEDWERDPFTLIEEDGFLFGRGVSDNKFELSMVVATLVRLKREGFVPVRDIVLALSGDEETTMESTRGITPRLKGAWMVVNTDGGANPVDAAGKPMAQLVQAGEKTYATFELRSHSAGGHSSVPTADNPIYRTAQALVKLQAYVFPVILSELSRASLASLAPRASGELRAAMENLAKNPDDASAAALISTAPKYSAMLRTTCVATMLDAGHAENALPQKAVATVNCRILPGTSIDSVQQTLTGVIADPQIEVVLLDRYPDAPASPLRADLMEPLRKVVDLRYPGLPIIPTISPGASDNLYFRAAGIDSYCVGSLFMKPEDSFIHGLNERVPAGEIGPALVFWNALLRDLATAP